MEEFIRAIDLSYSYRTGTANQVDALNKINLIIYKGEMLAIAGQNGSGKSTLARHFNGLLKPVVGNLLVEGLSTTNPDNIPIIRRRVGMVFQNPDNQLVSSIVEEDIAFGPENLGLPQAEIVDRVDWAIDMLNLQDLRYESPLRLSEGQKQLVAIAGVLAMKPSCIVLDEPTAHLDPRSKREVLDNIITLNRKEGITIVLLTHFMNETVHCDRMVIMNQGEIKIEGTPRKIFSDTKTVIALGLDLPVATQLACGLRQRGLEIPEGTINSEELINHLCLLK